ncbi:MAG TPA: RNA-binding cell elongation regulator Jag/EloR [Acidimicrobiia bacterium]|jgi:spoIIIJ-associated protein|nr:RNA-binding cell elongation regulator Jag/EloR [Acidimicrobiia bacterium]
MDWIEVTAKTVEDAKELALDRLGVVEDELEYEVLDEPKGGLFRRGDARIRARVKPLSREKPVDKRRRRRGNERQGGSRQGSRGGGSSRTAAPARTAVADAPDDDIDESSDGRSAAANNGAGSDRSRSRRRGGRGRGGRGNSAARTSPRRDDERDAEAQVDVETMPVGEQADHAEAFAAELVQKMGFTASVRASVEDDDVMVRIDGDELGVLVGPRGVTLHALEEVVRAAVQHHAGGHSARVHVDVGGYRERRREALAAFAQKIAAEVKEQGTARSLEPMNAADRKVVHDTVAEVEGVATESEGEDPRRRVVIRPA